MRKIYFFLYFRGFREITSEKINFQSKVQSKKKADIANNLQEAL
jgi:hypothetical protein